MTSINQISLRQAITPDRLMGRVNGTMRFVSLGLAPVGALVGGVLGDLIGLRPTLVIGAIGLQIGFAILYLSPVRALKDVPETMSDPEGRPRRRPHDGDARQLQPDRPARCRHRKRDAGGIP